MTGLAAVAGLGVVAAVTGLARLSMVTTMAGLTGLVHAGLAVVAGLGTMMAGARTLGERHRGANERQNEELLHMLMCVGLVLIQGLEIHPAMGKSLT